MKTVLSYLVVAVVALSVGAVFVMQIEKELSIREAAVVDWKVEVCGEEYRAVYQDALRRAISIGGAVVHEPNCRVRVVWEY